VDFASFQLCGGLKIQAEDKGGQMEYRLIGAACICVLAGSLFQTGYIVQDGNPDERTAGEISAGIGQNGGNADELRKQVCGRISADVMADMPVAYARGMSGLVMLAEDERGSGESENPPAVGNAGGASPADGGNAEYGAVISLSAGIQEFFDKGIDFFNESLGDYGLTEEDLAGMPGLTETEDVQEYADLAIANVTNYVNVRAEPNVDSPILGKIYDGAVAHVLSVAGEENDWFQVISGNVEGYIKAEYFLYGEEARAEIDHYVTRYAVVIADRLNVRENPSIESKRVGYIDNGERAKILEDQGEWLRVQYTDSATGYVAAQYVTVSEEFAYAKTLEEEAAELAAKRELEARRQVSEKQAAENTYINVTPPDVVYSTNEELRQQIVDYAMQYLGNKYVHGGQTLAGGTDCSGFTSLIYAEFGYSLSRTPAGQLSSAGKGIDYSEIQPGDVICYGSDGTCTHVALYIGNGQIIHAANSRAGVVIGNALYDTILGVKNIVD